MQLADICSVNRCMCCPKTYKTLFIGLIAALAACSPGEITNEMLDSDAKSDKNAISLTEYGFPVALHMSEEEASAILIDYNSADGRLLVTCGTDCGFFLMEDPMTIAEFKAELMNQELFTYQFFDEGTESVFYTSFLPDGNEYNHHYARVLTVNGRRFIAVSDEDVVMSIYAVRNMAKIIDSIHGIE